MAGRAPDFTARAGTLKMAGQPFQLKGASWFGADGAGKVPDGLWVHNASFYLNFLARNGFNAVRLPFALDNALSDDLPDANMLRAVPAWRGLRYLDVIERIVDAAADEGLLVLLDLQRLRSTVWPDDGLWFAPGITLEKVMTMWDRIQNRFCSHWNVLGADLLNEPHGAIWADWATAATSLGNFVLSRCPRWLIFVEGVAHKGHEDVSEFFWGENLIDAGRQPLALGAADKIVYSPHVCSAYARVRHGTAPTLCIDLM